MLVNYSPVSFQAKRLLPDNLRAVASQVNHGDIDKDTVVKKAVTELQELQTENSDPIRRGALKGFLKSIGAEDILGKLTGKTSS
ncbi:MAG: hypothetical protein PHC34_02495 [Candidatus Gastranaerophilales bacterium]|nr:hypothetical protein [Candidatus Gastranaerophilales bacterium]